MVAHIRTQNENPRMSESGLTLDKIMRLYINFHRLVLTQGSSYTELPKWIKRKKAEINLQNKDEKCFKWAVAIALHHEEIKKIINAHRIWSLMKTDITGKDLSFQYRSIRLISLKRITLP